MPIILVVDAGKFEVPEDAMSELRVHAERAHKFLREGSPTKLREEQELLLTALLEKGMKISLVDPRPVDLILPSPSSDYELLRRVFISVG